MYFLNSYFIFELYLSLFVVFCIFFDSSDASHATLASWRLSMIEREKSFLNVLNDLLIARFQCHHQRLLLRKRPCSKLSVQWDAQPVLLLFLSIFSRNMLFFYLLRRDEEVIGLQSTGGPKYGTGWTKGVVKVVIRKCSTADCREISTLRLPRWLFSLIRGACLVSEVLRQWKYYSEGRPQMAAGEEEQPGLPSVSLGIFGIERLNCF